MKLNKKGYMLVEIIVAFTLTFSIAMYLLNLTLKFKDTNEDIYYSAKYLKDKNLITRNIMNDLEKNIINVSGMNKTNKELTFEVKEDDGNTKTRKLIINNNTITYHYRHQYHYRIPIYSNGTNINKYSIHIISS